MDERLRTCSCRGWQLNGYPCEHGFAAIYFLHRDPEHYVSDWYSKDKYVAAYSKFIEGMNGMDQWPSTEYQKPLPPIKRRMPGRPAYKRKRDAFEKGDGGNRTRISRKGQPNHCKICKETGHNQRSCPRNGKEGPSKNQCTICKESGHNQRKCPKKGSEQSTSTKKKGSAQSTSTAENDHTPSVDRSAQTPCTPENEHTETCGGSAHTPSTLVEYDQDEIPIIGSAPVVISTLPVGFEMTPPDRTQGTVRMRGGVRIRGGGG